MHILKHWGLEVQHRNLGDMTPSLSPTLPGSSELGAEWPRVHAQESLRDTRHQSLTAKLPKCKSPLVPRTTGRRISRTGGPEPSPGQTALEIWGSGPPRSLWGFLVSVLGRSAAPGTSAAARKRNSSRAAPPACFPPPASGLRPAQAQREGAAAVGPRRPGAVAAALTPCPSQALSRRSRTWASGTGPSAGRSLSSFPAPRTCVLQSR